MNQLQTSFRLRLNKQKLNYAATWKSNSIDVYKIYYFLDTSGANSELGLVALTALVFLNEDAWLYQDKISLTVIAEMDI